jgi:hypothetical protein
MYGIQTYGGNVETAVPVETDTSVEPFVMTILGRTVCVFMGTAVVVNV